jgi:lipoprotein-anchoring transpeptidase ErfK/SrfK
VRVYTKYRTVPARKTGTSHFQWVLVAMLVGFLGWVWWKNLQHAARPSRPEQANTVQVTPVFRATRNGSSNAVTSLVLARPATSGAHESGSAGPHPPRNTYEVQVALARQGICVGSLDGALGSQTRAALRAFQQKERLPVTGEADAATKGRLLLSGPPETCYTVTAADLGRLSPVGTTWLAKSVQDRLDYENILELVSEKGHAHPNLVRMLNPSVDWNHVTPGATIRIPDCEYPPVRAKAAFIRLRLSEKTLDAFDRGTNLLAHFPCSIARQVEKRPVGRLEVETIALNPNYKFSPEIFPESEEARQLKRPLMIPQGPNNPVGTAWIGLNRPGYGIHGTPRPEEVGRTESHGCFRLANWNADYLAQLVEIGTPVIIEP